MAEEHDKTHRLLFGFPRMIEDLVRLCLGGDWVERLPFCPRPWRKRLARVPLADWIMVWFVAVAVVLTVIAVMFRGPGWSWTLPWREGIY